MIYLISKKLELFANGFIIDDNTSRLDNWAMNKVWIGLDTETSSLKYWNGNLNLIQFGDFDNQFVVDMHTIPITDLLPIFSSKKFILQNAKFDLQWLKKHGVELEYIYDTLLAENILYCGLNPKKSLEALTMKYCDVYLSKSERGTTNYLNTSHIVYAANDVKYLHLIKEQQEKDCAEKELEKIFELEFEFVKIVAEMEYYGLQLNKDLWKELTKKAEAQVESTIIELDKIVRADIKLKRFVKPVVQSMMFGFSEREIDINYASPIQILKVLKALGFDKLKDTNENSLSEFEHEFIDKLLEFRGASKLANTYGEEFLNMVRPDGSIATNYTQIVDTGRMASKEPNLQNIPQEQDYRTPFSGEENEWLICADYSGIELVLVIEDSKEEVWVKAQNEGLDLHMINAQMTFGMNAWNHAKLPDCTYEEDKKHKCKCPIHGDMRNSTKTVTYASLFGATGERIGKILKIGKNAGETILKKYFKALPTLRNWMDDIIQYAAIYHKIRTFRPYRRTRFFNPDEHPEERAKKAVNARIQGTAADIFKQACVNIKQRLVQEGIAHKFRGAVHDEVLLSFQDKETAEIAGPIVREEMKKSGDLLTKLTKLDVSIVISKHWLK